MFQQDQIEISSASHLRPFHQKQLTSLRPAKPLTTMVISMPCVLTKLKCPFLKLSITNFFFMNLVIIWMGVKTLTHGEQLIGNQPRYTISPILFCLFVCFLCIICELMKGISKGKRCLSILQVPSSDCLNCWSLQRAAFNQPLDRTHLAWVTFST